MKQITNIRKIETVKDNNMKIVNIKEYTDSIFDEPIIKSLLKSEEDIKAGRTRKATEVIRELEEKYGF